jgi:hypothetical protein
MLVRWIVATVLILGLVVSALDLSANVRHRTRARRPPSVADIVSGRADEPSPPHAAEAEETPAIAPTITY